MFVGERTLEHPWVSQENDLDEKGSLMIFGKSVRVYEHSRAQMHAARMPKKTLQDIL